MAEIRFATSRAVQPEVLAARGTVPDTREELKAAYNVVSVHWAKLDRSDLQRMNQVWSALVVGQGDVPADIQEWLRDAARRFDPNGVQSMLERFGQSRDLREPDNVLAAFLASARHWADRAGVDFHAALDESYQTYLDDGEEDLPAAPLLPRPGARG